MARLWPARERSVRWRTAPERSAVARTTLIDLDRGRGPCGRAGPHLFGGRPRLAPAPPRHSHPSVGPVCRCRERSPRSCPGRLAARQRVTLGNPSVAVSGEADHRTVRCVSWLAESTARLTPDAPGRERLLSWRDFRGSLLRGVVAGGAPAAGRGRSHPRRQRALATPAGRLGRGWGEAASPARAQNPLGQCLQFQGRLVATS